MDLLGQVGMLPPDQILESEDDEEQAVSDEDEEVRCTEGVWVLELRRPWQDSESREFTHLPISFEPELTLSFMLESLNSKGYWSKKPIT